MIDKAVLSKAYVEVLEILNFIPYDDYQKIPSSIIENMYQNIDDTYRFRISDFDNFQNQPLLKETEAILAVLYRDYLTTEEEKKYIKGQEKRELFLLEKEKSNRYQKMKENQSLLNNKKEEFVVPNKVETAIAKKEGIISRICTIIKNKIGWRK